MQINLLAPKSGRVYRKKTGTSSLLPIVAGAMVVVSLLATVTVGLLNYRAESEIAEAKTGIANLRKAEDQLKTRERCQTELRQIQKAHKTIADQKPAYTKNLDALIKVMPAAAVLKEITLEEDKETKVLRVLGSAPSQQVVAQMGSQMHKEPLLKKAEVFTSKLDENMYNFEITIQGGGK